MIAHQTVARQLLAALNATQDRKLLPVIADALRDDGRDLLADGMLWLVRRRKWPSEETFGGTNAWVWYHHRLADNRGEADCELSRELFRRVNLSCKRPFYCGRRNKWTTDLSTALLSVAGATP